MRDFAALRAAQMNLAAIIDFWGLHPYKPPTFGQFGLFGLARSKNNAPCTMQIQEGPHSAVFKINEAYLSTI
jgi:hypothetical protein